MKDLYYTTYIEPKFVSRINILDTEKKVLDFVSFFSKCPFPEIDETDYNPKQDFKYEISVNVLMNRFLFEELRNKYQKDFYEPFKKARVLIINNVSFCEISPALWSYPQETYDEYVKRITKDCELYSVSFNIFSDEIESLRWE